MYSIVYHPIVSYIDLNTLDVFFFSGAVNFGKFSQVVDLKILGGCSGGGFVDVHGQQFCACA